jgi:gamma-glutamylcyclotransferase (GGCT)/AIG2-like uncharacterized protein YtfP
VLITLFVYGTLRSEFDNPYARLLRSQAELVGPATVPGSIFRVEHYPAWKSAPAGEVRGELYRLTDPETTLKALDEYEGPDFDRVMVTTEDMCRDESRHGTQECVRHAWIYRYRKEPPESSRIASGDFCAP